jgi:SAM-dependent methyltransferase
MVECDICTLTYLRVRPPAAELWRYYPSESYYAYGTPTPYSLFQSENLVASVWYFVKKSVLSYEFGYSHLGGKSLVAKLARARVFGSLRRKAAFELGVLLHPFVENGSLLEVGCGSGMYLGLMKALGWKRVVGVDFSPTAIRRVKESPGIEAYCGQLADVGFEAGSFDAVSLSHTLEHVPDPVSFLCEVRRILKPNGRLAIVVPNVGSYVSQLYGPYWYHLDAPRHQVNFSRRTLALALEKSGFQIRKMTTKARGAYAISLHSNGRRLGDDVSNLTNPHHHYSLRRRVLARSHSFVEHVQCAAGLAAGEEIAAIAVKPD